MDQPMRHLSPHRLHCLHLLRHHPHEVLPGKLLFVFKTPSNSAKRNVCNLNSLLDSTCIQMYFGDELLDEVLPGNFFHFKDP